MYRDIDRFRIIPCLLLSGEGLVKTAKFRHPRYIGDPVNTLAIFNDKEVDEIVVLDIDATRNKRPPNFAKIEEMTGQCFMPLTYGGGISSLNEIQTIIGLGVEKVVLNSAALHDSDLLRRAADRFGSQSIVASIDVKRAKSRRNIVRTHGGRKTIRRSLESVVDHVVSSGAGEILIQSIDRDGSMMGYDLELIGSITRQVELPVIALGGAGTVGDLAAAIGKSGASAAAAGSLFVFYGRHNAVLISYPDSTDVRDAVAKIRQEADK